MDKGVHAFPKGICPKMNVIAQLKFELAYNPITVHLVIHYVPTVPPIDFLLIYLTTPPGIGNERKSILKVEVLYFYPRPSRQSEMHLCKQAEEDHVI